MPFYAVNAVFDRLRASYPNYIFRQPALNPTNPGDRATPHEVELIRRFRGEAAPREIQGVRQDGERDFFYLAVPVRVSQEQCLVCHSTPERAPAAMVAEYGRSNGFGWKLNETVGMLELSVPITEELRGVIELTATLAVGLLVVFLVTYLALTTALGSVLVRPLQHLAERVDAISRSVDGPTDLPRAGTVELRELSDAIARLNTSLRKALQQIAGRKPASRRPPERD